MEPERIVVYKMEKELDKDGKYKVGRGGKGAG